MTVTVNVTFVLIPGVALLTVFVTARFASGTSTDADAELFPLTGSKVVAVTVAVLVICVCPVTVATMTRVSVAPLATVPTFHTPAL